MMPAPNIPETITGPELVALIEREAAARSVRPAVLVETISSQPHSWLTQVRRAGKPRAHTIALVRALFIGALPPKCPPERRNSALQKSGKRRRPDHYVAAKPEWAPPPVNRDPCFFCETRADVGCRHSRQRARA